MRTALLRLMCLAALACGSPAPMQPLPDDSECNRGTREADLAEGDWAGSGLLADAGLPDLPDAVLSSTYLALNTDADSAALFQQVFGAVRADLSSRQGLVAWKVATSTRCNSARTLSVWADEAAMMSFVIGTAHSNAAAKVGKISRGNSAVVSWHDSTAGATLDNALQKLGAADAPF